MRKLLVALLLLAGVTAATAQEVYNSSGKKTYNKRKKTGYDPDRLVIGGWMNLGFGGGFASIGVAPIVGYRLTKDWSAGVGFGYQFNRLPRYIDPIDPNKPYFVTQHMYYPSVWTRYFVFRNIFLSAAFEYDFIRQNNYGAPYDPMGYPSKVVYNVTNPCALVGVGLRQPIGGRVSFYGELFYDVLQGEYSPYPKNFPALRFGIVAGL